MLSFGSAWLFSFIQKMIVELAVFVLEDVEDDLFHTGIRVLVQPPLHSFYGNFRRLVLRKHEDTGRDAAKSNRSAVVLCRKVQTGAVALGQFGFVTTR